jgi:hypothetical protein
VAGTCVGRTGDRSYAGGSAVLYEGTPGAVVTPAPEFGVEGVEGVGVEYADFDAPKEGEMCLRT